jgi:phosphatidylserine/phosphatidylglycerophosphate/cardiolipin synthase-like enzyme
LVVKTIESAKNSIRVAAYSFTSKRIAIALLDAQKRGVDVRVVAERSNATARYTTATFLANQGVPVRLDYRISVMHDKFLIVDGRTLETGSFNFTGAAEARNAENVLVLHDAALAQQFGQEWGSALERIGRFAGALLSGCISMIERQKQDYQRR